MPKTNDIPLTEEQAAFAAEHEKLIGKYLKIRHLPTSEYYDVVMFGYLRAVRRYLTIPELRAHKFKTIAFKAMQSDLGSHFRALRAEKRSAPVVEYIADLHTNDLSDPVTTLVERRADYLETRKRVFQCLTPTQGKIIALKVRGYSDCAAATEGGFRRPEVKAELKAARDNITRFAPELAERAA